jgi:hypothetical protein
MKHYVCVCAVCVCVCAVWAGEGGARKGRPSIYSLRSMKLQRWRRRFWIPCHRSHSAASPTAPTAILSNGWTQGLTWLGSHAVRNFCYEDGGTSFPTDCRASATIHDVRSDLHSMDVRFESLWFLSYPPHPIRDSTLQKATTLHPRCIHLRTVSYHKDVCSIKEVSSRNDHYGLWIGRFGGLRAGLDAEEKIIVLGRRPSSVLYLVECWLIPTGCHPMSRHAKYHLQLM